MTTATEKTTDLLVAVLSDLEPVVGRVTGEQLHEPTPCTELDVGQLRAHILGWLTTFAAGFADPGGQAPLDRLDGYTVPADPAARGAFRVRRDGRGAARGRGRPAPAARGQRDAG